MLLETWHSSWFGRLPIAIAFQLPLLQLDTKIFPHDANTSHRLISIVRCSKAANLEGGGCSNLIPQIEQKIHRDVNTNINKQHLTTRWHPTSAGSGTCNTACLSRGAHKVSSSCGAAFFMHVKRKVGLRTLYAVVYTQHSQLSAAVSFWQCQAWHVSMGGMYMSTIVSIIHGILQLP